VLLPLGPFRRSSRLLLVAIVLAVVVVTLALMLALTDTFSPRGIVFGTFIRCQAWECWMDKNPRYEPEAGARIEFDRVGTNRKYVAVTDAKGTYSISLPAGHYVIRAFYLIGPHELTVIAGQSVEADFNEM
jgi:hypothetical protein